MLSKYQHITFPYKILPEKYFYNVTDIFGYRPWRKKRWPNTNGYHSGIDIGTRGKTGIEVYTPYDGMVTRIMRSSKNAGQYITIRHDKSFVTRYLHLKDTVVAVNQYVKAGQLIGHTGNTGHSTGPHLHFEVRINNKPVDPAPYLYGYALEDSKNGGFVPNKKVLFKDNPDFSSQLDEKATELKNEKVKVDVNERYASGIWQIIKTVIDPEVADKQINDATISMMQGSLFNFFEKVIQKPFVEFFGDTYGDQYYFIVRKPPFTEKAFKSLFTINIQDDKVFSEELSFDNEHIYSWYQLTPNGNYIGGQDLIFQYLAAVYFPEYGEIWGSKPLTIVTNYITFIKESGDIQLQAALQDLKFLIDIHSYLPFTRKGTITIQHNRKIKKGMRILYEPTDEYFYVDSVSHTINSNSGIIDATTTLQVSRGMKRKYVDVDIKHDETLSYFNLINFGNTKHKVDGVTDNAIPNDINFNLNRTVAYFNEDKYTFDENDIREKYDVLNDDYLYKNELRITNEMFHDNFANSKEIAEFLYKYKNVKLVLYGYTNANGSKAYNLKLSKKRAKTIKELIKDYYKSLGGDLNDADKRLIIKAEGINSKYDNNNAIGKLLNRRVDVFLEQEFDEIVNKKDKQEKLQPPKDGHWRVNKKVFTFFLRKQQFLTSTDINDI